METEQQRREAEMREFFQDLKNQHELVSALVKADWNLARAAELLGLPEEAILPRLLDVNEGLLILAGRKSLLVKQMQLDGQLQAKLIDCLDRASPTELMRMSQGSVRRLASLLGIQLADEPADREPEKPSERLAQAKLDKESREGEEWARFIRKNADLLRKYGGTLSGSEGGIQ